MTNRKMLSKMSNEELAELFNFEDNIRDCYCCFLQDFCDKPGQCKKCNYNCNNVFVEWLESEAE